MKSISRAAACLASQLISISRALENELHACGTRGMVHARHAGNPVSVRYLRCLAYWVTALLIFTSLQTAMAEDFGNFPDLNHVQLWGIVNWLWALFGWFTGFITILMKTLANQYAHKLCLHSPCINIPLTLSTHYQQSANYDQLWSQKYNENCKRICTCLFAGIVTPVYWITFKLSRSWQ